MAELSYRSQADKELAALRAIDMIALGELTATEEQRRALYHPVGYANATGPGVGDAATVGVLAAQIRNLTDLRWQVADYKNRVQNWALNYPYETTKPPFPPEPEVITSYRKAWLGAIS